MLDFIMSPVFQYFNIIDPWTALLFSYFIAIVITMPFWVLSAWQDWKTQEIEGWPLLVITAATVAHAVLFVNWLTAALVCWAAYFAFRSKEFSLVGQADFLLFAHWLTASFCYQSGIGVMFVSSVIFLLCIIIYIAVYRDSQGRRWRPGKMVPLFPPYAASVVTLTVIQYPLSRMLYALGW